jgi:hypothetical protein
MSERKMVRTLVDPYSQDEMFSGETFDDVINRMLRLKEQYKGRDVRYGLDTLDYNDHSELYLFEYREETDAEQGARLAKEQVMKERQEQRERAELERLKKKFE